MFNVHPLQGTKGISSNWTISHDFERLITSDQEKKSFSGSTMKAVALAKKLLRPRKGIIIKTESKRFNHLHGQKVLIHV